MNSIAEINFDWNLDRHRLCFASLLETLIERDRLYAHTNTSISLSKNGLPVEIEANDEILSMPFTQEMFTNGFKPDPFENELSRIRHSMKCLELKHEQKRLMNILPQYDKEMENIRRKYDLLLSIEYTTFTKKKTLLAELRQKAGRGLSVDKELIAHFGEHLELCTSHQHQGQIPEQLGEFIVGQAPPTNQVDVFSFNSIAGPLPPRAIVEQLASTFV